MDQVVFSSLYLTSEFGDLTSLRQQLTSHEKKIVDSFTGQILLVATPASCNSNVDQTVGIARNFLHSYGQLFAFIRVSNSSTRSLRAIAEFCDIAHCMKILSNCTHVTTPEVIMRSYWSGYENKAG